MLQGIQLLVKIYDTMNTPSNIELQDLSTNGNANYLEGFDFLSELANGLNDLVNTIQKIEKAVGEE